MDFNVLEPDSSYESQKRLFMSDPDTLEDLPSQYVTLDDKNLRNSPFAVRKTCKTHGYTDGDIDLHNINLPLLFRTAKQHEDFDCKKTEKHKSIHKQTWKCCHFSSLPKWLQDNNFLHGGHRPPLPSFGACFRSIFRIHTETGNIWTHLLGCIFFIWVGLYFITRPSHQIQLQEKIIFSIFFAGAISCLGTSFAFHTLQCHSEKIGRIFSKLDYCGISFLITCSFVPWLYYGFYCNFTPKLIYLIVVIVLGATSIVISLPDEFSEPRFRSVRAGVFMVFGLSGVIPAIHYLATEGWMQAMYQSSFGWLCLTGMLYIIGAVCYATRFPERLFPGKFDIWFHSHQIFHVLVIAAICVYYHGITILAMFRLTMTDCVEKPPQPIFF